MTVRLLPGQENIVLELQDVGRKRLNSDIEKGLWVVGAQRGLVVKKQGTSDSVLAPRVVPCFCCHLKIRVCAF